MYIKFGFESLHFSINSYLKVWFCVLINIDSFSKRTPKIYIQKNIQVFRQRVVSIFVYLIFIDSILKRCLIIKSFHS